jgi:hypothetical protein
MFSWACDVFSDRGNIALLTEIIALMSSSDQLLTSKMSFVDCVVKRFCIIWL